MLVGRKDTTRAIWKTNKGEKNLDKVQRISKLISGLKKGKKEWEK